MAARKAASSLFAKGYSSPSLSFVYNPLLKTIEADKQTLIWTKTHQIDTLPASVIAGMDGLLELEKWRKIVSSSIVQPKGYENSEKDRVHRDYVFGVFPNLVRSLFSAIPGIAKDKHVSWNGSVAASWNRNDDRYTIRGRPGVVVSSRRRLSQFYPADVVHSTAEQELPSTWPISCSADLHTLPNVAEKFSTGTHPSTAFPHLHTMVLAHNQRLQDMHILQRGLCMLFARLLSEARRSTASPGDAGREGTSAGPAAAEDDDGAAGPPSARLPLCGQCLVTNGKKFTFIFFQLNSLDLREDGGVKNLVCVEGPHLLYSKVQKRGPSKVLTNLNDRVVRLLVSTLTNS